MPLTADDFVHENTGTVTTPGTSCVVALAGADSTTAGNTLIVFLTALVGVTPPAGFIQDKFLAVNLYVFRKSEVAAAETSWTFTTSTNSSFAWYVVELSGVDPVEPLDASATSGATFASTSNGGTRSTGTAPLNAGLNTVVFGVFSAIQTAGSTESWSNYTNGFEEVADVSPNGDSAYQLAVARNFVNGTTGTFSTTATLATSSASASTAALLVAYRAADSPIVAPLAHLVGFEQGTHGGINSHTGVTSLTGAGFAVTAGTWGTNYLVQSGSARNSNYGLRVVQAGAAAYVRAGNINFGSASAGFDARVVSATGTVVVASLTALTGGFLGQLLYDTSTSKFGVRAGNTGTTSWQSGTTATNTWVWVDLRVKVNSTTWRVEWRIETGTDIYTDQTFAELTGQTATAVYMLEMGANAAQTMTADFDNAVVSSYWVAFPLGPHNVKLLTVDPAGTPTVSGTSTNFSVMTANGTLAAWNATNARNAVDEVPPTVSASADGVVQTAVAANDYIEFPMATYAPTATETIVGVRMLAAAWGGTGTGTGTLGFRGWDGATETDLVPASTSYDAGSPTAVSSTEPRWQCAMWQRVNGWIQSALDAAAVRVGFSTDATPDMGIDAVYLEVAVGPVRTARTMDAEDGVFAVDKRYNPNSAAPVSWLVTTPANRGATFAYTLLGTPTSTYVNPGSSQVVVVSAETLADVTDTQLYPDPDPDQPG